MWQPQGRTICIVVPNTLCGTAISTRSPWGLAVVALASSPCPVRRSARLAQHVQAAGIEDGQPRLRTSSARFPELQRHFPRILRGNSAANVKQLIIMQKSAITVLTIFVTIVSMGGCPKENADDMNHPQELPPTASDANHPQPASEPAAGTPVPEQNQKADATVPNNAPTELSQSTKEPVPSAKYEKATFAAGCFWGIEASFRAVEGVVETQIGYTGGRRANPTYPQVCTDKTGHAEAVEVTYDPEKVSFERLLDLFWKIHDPTTLNRQDPDVGTQYRSAIFYYSPEQKTLAEASMQNLVKARTFKRPIVTQILPAPRFYRAEEYHQRYLEKQGKTSCSSTIH